MFFDYFLNIQHKESCNSERYISLKSQSLFGEKLYKDTEPIKGYAKSVIFYLSETLEKTKRDWMFYIYLTFTNNF